MYKLTNLQQTIKDIRGIPLQDLTIKGMLAESLGQYSGNNVSGKEKLLANSLGIDVLKTEKDEIDISKEMFDLVKSAVEKLDFKVFIYAQIIDAIKEITEDGK